MTNIYDIYLQFKAIGAIEYKKELFIFSKEIETIFIQKATEEEYQTYYILPYYQMMSIIKKDIATKNKSIFHKIKNGKILFDNIHFIAKLRDYIDFLLKQKAVNIDFLFVREQLSVISDQIKEYDSLQNLKLKEIFLSAMKQRVLYLYDALYFDKEKMITQIERSECEIEQKQFLAINQLFKLTSKTDTPKLEKTIANLIAQNPILSYYQSVVNNSKKLESSKPLFVILKTNYPYEDIIFDIKTTFERKTQSKLYAKYDSTKRQIVFEIFTNDEKKYKQYEQFTTGLKKKLDSSKAIFRMQLTDAYPDIWAFELTGLEDAKQLLNNDIHKLILAYKDHWTQDYAVSAAIIIISKILQTLYENESECLEIIKTLYENWFIFLFEDHAVTDIYKFSKNKDFRTDSLMKHVESMHNDIALLTGFFKNKEVKNLIGKVQETVTMIISKHFGNDVERDHVILGLLMEICSLLGVYNKNLPYLALLIKTYKNSLWKII